MGREPFFAYGQGTAESRISGEGGERYAGAGAQRAFPKRKGAARGYEAAGHWYGYTKRAVSYTSGEVVSAGGGAYI